MKRIFSVTISFALILLAVFLIVLKLHDPAYTTLNDIRSAGQTAYIEQKLDEMSLEEKIGQMFMGCFYNGTPSPETVSRYHLGSVLLFHSSFAEKDKASVISQLKAINDICNIKPIIAVDEEGGTVNRISNSPSFRSEPFKSPREIFASGGMDAIIKDTHDKNAFLSELGINLNLAPVCDISQNPKDFMFSRSLGQNAQITSQYAAAVTKACLEDNIGCCLKHFPGYGNSADTHKGMSIDKRSEKQLEENDFLPFKAGIDAGAPSVLVSHNIVSSLDESLPASLSPAVHRILRYDMNFSGVIITDDLFMGAVSNFSPKTDSAVTAIMAGNDILCTGDFASQYKAVLEAVNNGTISEERIDTSVRRILLWKKDLSLF